MRQKRFAQVAVLSLMMPSIHDVIAQTGPACATVATMSGQPWVESGSDDLLSLQQDSTGAITGTEIGCGAAIAYNVQGTYEGNGNFQISELTSNPPAGCPLRISISGTVYGAGCNNVAFAYSDSRETPLILIVATSLPGVGVVLIRMLLDLRRHWRLTGAS